MLVVVTFLALVSGYNAAVVQSRPLRPAVLQRVSITAAVAEATDAPPVAARSASPAAAATARAAAAARCSC